MAEDTVVKMQMLGASDIGDAGYARLDTTIKPTPMVVPTPKLLKLLELTSHTTDLEPLALPRVRHCVGQSEASRQAQYLRAFKSTAMAERMANFLVVLALASLFSQQTKGGDARASVQ